MIITIPGRRESEQRYEELRREILEGTRGPAPGLAIFLRGGMVSWLRELGAWVAAASSPSGRDLPSPAGLPPGTRGEIVRGLAGMILGRAYIERV